jgi:hypothetical protein
MVFIILLGAAMLTSGFRAFGGEELVRDFLQDLPGGFWTQFVVVMIVIFLLGFFLDFIEIAVVVVPIIAPILLAETGANVTAVWLGVMIGVNLQTSFLTPPFGFALFYLKGVAPKIVQTLDIWKGVVPFIALQLVGLAIVGSYPTLVNYLPNRVYLTSKVAPPPMNPKLQYCLQEYKFANYTNNEEIIKNSINDFDGIILANLPADKLSYFQRHVDNSNYTFELVEEVKNTQAIYNDYAVDYKDLHFKTRKKQKKISKLNKKIDKLKAEIRNLDDDEVSDKNKINQKIENVKLEIDEVANSISDNWKSKNDEFNKINKAKNIAVKKYRKTADNAYDDLMLIKLFILDGEKFEELSNDIKILKSKIDNRSYLNAIEDIDNMFDKVGEISGSDEFADKLDYLITLMDEDEKDPEQIQKIANDTYLHFDKEVSWRKEFNKKYMDRINAHLQALSETIGLRLQQKLTKEQAIYVSKCNSVHRDISLNF